MNGQHASEASKVCNRYDPAPSRLRLALPMPRSLSGRHERPCDEVLLQIDLAASIQVFGRDVQNLDKHAGFHTGLEPMASRAGQISTRHVNPDCASVHNPEDAAHHLAWIAARSAPAVGLARQQEDKWFDQTPLLVGQVHSAVTSA